LAPDWKASRKRNKALRDVDNGGPRCSTHSTYRSNTTSISRRLRFASTWSAAASMQLVEMRLDEFFRKRLQNAAAEIILSQDLRAIAIRLQHLFNALKVPHDFSSSQVATRRFILRVTMRMRAREHASVRAW